ncbi:MAG: tetratricopeptide repeat protein [Chlamydiota bacterium]
MSALATLLLFLCLSAPPAPSAVERVTRGQSLIALKRYDEAILEFKEVLKHDPMNGAALFNLGYLYGTFLGDTATGDRYWNCYKAASCISLGDVALSAGDLAEAAVHYQEAMKHLPENAALHERLGMICLQLGREADALRELKAAVELDPADTALQTRIAPYFWASGNRREAAACVDRIAAANPQDPAKRRRAVELFTAAGERGKALEQLAALSASGAATPEEHCTLAGLLLGEGRLKEAAAEIRAGFSPATRKRCAGIARALAEACEKQGALPEATEVYRETIAAGAGSPELFNALALACHRQGKLDAAIEAASGGVDAFPDNSALHNNLATLLALRMDYPGAIEEYRKAAELDPGLAEAWLDMGLIYRDYLKDETAAAEAFKRYLALKPEAKSIPEVARALGLPPPVSERTPTPARERPRRRLSRNY